MYRIVSCTSGIEIGLVDEVTYIRISDEGSFTPTDEDHAQGVAFDSVPYAIQDREVPENNSFVDTVTVSRFNGGEYIAEQQRVLDSMVLSMLS